MQQVDCGSLATCEISDFNIRRSKYQYLCLFRGIRCSILNRSTLKNSDCDAAFTHTLFAPKIHIILTISLHKLDALHLGHERMEHGSSGVHHEGS